MPTTTTETCLSFSADAIRQHFDLCDESVGVDDLSNAELDSAVRRWMEAGDREPWETYDRWIRHLVAAIRASRYSP
jgi:hypothetical protein